MTGGELNGNGAQMKRSTRRTTALFGLIEEAGFKCKGGVALRTSVRNS